VTFGYRPTVSTYLHYGWPVSPYSAKSRAALRVSGLPWSEVQPHALTLAWLQSHVGRKVIPVLRTPSGAFIQDSSRIVDTIERESGLPMTPPAGLARVLALWLEVFADEWMIYPAMAFRWRYAGGGWDATVEHFGHRALPGWPASMRARAGREVAGAMNRYLPIMGVTDETWPAIVHETEALLDRLAARLDDAPYVLGGTPCIADFALYGPLAAHLGHDAWSAHVIDDRPRVRAWIDRLDRAVDRPATLALGEIPESLAPVLRSVFRLAAPAWLAAYTAAEAHWSESAHSLPRRLGRFDARLRDAAGNVVIHAHKLTAVTVWKMSRAVQALVDAGDAAGDIARQLAECGAGSLAELAPLPGLTLQAIQFRDDPTQYGRLGGVLDRVTPMLRSLPARGPAHARRRGPVAGLG
jgi:glutathione S-transferase